MTLLDKIPDSGWFFCFPMSIAVWCIIALGIIHPFFWLKVWRVYRSELFMLMYLLVAVWSILSCAMVYGVVTVCCFFILRGCQISTQLREMESACVYVFWIWFTLAFCLVMAGLMFLLFCGFCVLGMKRKSVGALIGLLYYVVTLYFVVVVNKQRKEVFGPEPHCGDCFVENIEKKAYELAPGLVANKHRIGVTDSSIRTTTSPTVTNVIISTFPTADTTSPTVRTTTTTAQPFLNEDDTVKLALRSLAAFLSQTSVATKATEPPLTRTWAGALFRREVALNTTTPSMLLELTPSILSKWTLSMLSEWTPATLSEWTPATLSEWTPAMLSESTPSSTGPLDHQPDRGLSAFARLSDLLLNSDECRRPRHPAHGWYEVSGNSTALRVGLRCDPGYVEDSNSTDCKYNWWDRPLPQCRKETRPRIEVGCVLPRSPSHGRYTAEVARADAVVLTVACDAPYRPVDPSVVCVRGHWRHAPPECQKHCKLDPHPSVEYKCLNAFKGSFAPCSIYIAGGVTVLPSCRPAHAHRGPFRHMRCRAGEWDHVLKCAPNANFTL